MGEGVGIGKAGGGVQVNIMEPSRQGGGRLMFYSHNIRGMRNAAKRNKVLTYFQSKRNCIVYLQETYTAPGDMEYWKKIGKGKCFLVMEV